ncbi:MBL fold metallo-hydrolase [Antribacter gilvus]|uniref:MBL fold metallo-hydrolase n=1 Tax=Antribacter gilvus TaxID=2304675 RepID=UPI000F78DAD3|nr:MBL fold metallo-hydrolase [Antribacter gilvus]
MSDYPGYTGDVFPDCAADVRELDRLVIRKVSVGPADNNAYLLTCRRTGAQLLIDAAADAQRLMDLVDEAEGDGPGEGPLDQGPPLDVVATTHQHRDHLGALSDVVEVTGARTVAGAEDAGAIEAATGVRVETPLHHGDRVTFGEVALDVIHLRGHTPGSVTYAYTEPAGAHAPGAVAHRVHLFTGDSLFPGGVGNTQQDPERFAQLLGDVTDRLFDRFGDDTWVYPGHGKDTTLGRERPHLDEWRARGW